MIKIDRKTNLIRYLWLIPLLFMAACNESQVKFIAEPTAEPIDTPVREQSNMVIYDITDNREVYESNHIPTHE